MLAHSGGFLLARFIDELKRTHRSGSLRAADVGKEVVLFGWVATRRDHGGCVFIDLRDREGITQIVFDPAYRDPRATADPDVVARAHKLAEEARPEWVLGVRGVVVSRGSNVNPKLATGEIEVHVVEATIFNRADTPPFALDDDIETREEVRLEYRYLDLRRKPLQESLVRRSRVNQATRSYIAWLG
jgi:aspartyl-tRNA synthetase